MKKILLGGAIRRLALLAVASAALPLQAGQQTEAAGDGARISPAGGTYFKAPVVVKIASPLSGALIRYTLDGSEPDASSRQYMGAFPIHRTATVKARAFRAGAPEGPVAGATFTVEPALVWDPLKGSALVRPLGKGEFVAGGGWRSKGGMLVYDAGRLITDGYFEVTLAGLQVPARGVDKTHPLAGWESKNSYGHYEEKGAFWNWRMGAGYEAFKVLAASKSIETRVEERVGSAAQVNDGKPHVCRVSWKEGKLSFHFDGKELRNWTMERFQLRYFTLGHDMQYPEIPDAAPVFSDLKIVDRSPPARKPPAQ